MSKKSNNGGAMIQAGLKVGLMAATLLLGGCAEMSYNAEPRTITLSDPKAPTALILGQAYKESAGHYHILIVKSVDGIKTFSGWESRTPFNWYVPAGQRKFTAHAAFGNFGNSLEADPEFTGDVHAGRVYQLYGKEYEDSNGKSFVKLWIDEIGSVAQFEAYLKRNPEGLDGKPMTKQRLVAY
jgi:hypothetical protein